VKQILGGIGVGQTAVVAEVLKFDFTEPSAKLVRAEAEPANEKLLLERAIDVVAKQFTKLSVASHSESAEIFEALAELVRDEALLQESLTLIEDGYTAASSFANSVEKFCDLFGDDETMTERSADLRDISARVRAAISGAENSLSLPTSGSYILVAKNFSPADTARFTEVVAGVITEQGGATSHTAIICRALGIPALVGAAGAMELSSGVSVLLDPVADRAVVGGELSESTPPSKFEEISSEPLITVRANVVSLTDATSAAKTEALGVGLLRTELLFQDSEVEPTLQQQSDAYLELFEAAPVGPITVRTFDLESDKQVSYLPLEDLAFPTNYRLMEQYPQVLETQLKAIESARQQSGREVWVMAPMIGSAAEAKRFATLAKRLGEFKVGVMVELPELAEEVSSLAGLVDFISVGTNDLSRFLFRVDRLESSELLNHWQPKLISLLERIATSAKAAGIQSSVCGESASDPMFAIVLAGLGFDSVSVSRSQVEQVRSALSSVTHEAARAAAKAALFAK
jgi:phosphotransferase system enzyme I (PtsI)